MDEKRPKIRCAKPGCRTYAMRDGSGFCFNHNPVCQTERQKIRKECSERAWGKARGEAEQCKYEGCKGWPMHDGSGFCFSHNPKLVGERTALYTKNGKIWEVLKRPAERACKIKGCQGWTIEDGLGLCNAHRPENIAKQRVFMKGKRLRLGKPNPWLGLKDIREARGLLCYSLETNQPLLTLRALEKIVSLHRRGEIPYPGKYGIGAGHRPPQDKPPDVESDGETTEQRNYSEWNNVENKDNLYQNWLEGKNRSKL